MPKPSPGVNFENSVAESKVPRCENIQPVWRLLEESFQPRAVDILSIDDSVVLSVAQPGSPGQNLNQPSTEQP